MASTDNSGLTTEDIVESNYHRVDIIHLQALDVRSIGEEKLALHALQQLQLDQKLTALGFIGVDRAAAIGSIIWRMVTPGSELYFAWLRLRKL